MSKSRSDDRAVSLPPRVTAGTRVLVLGSMPGRRSLEERRYYAHPRNRLWRVLGDLLGFDPGAAYEERVQAALEAGVGFWDVLKQCERPGSLDASIRRSTEVPNDFATLLREHPRIRAFALNGRKAAATFERHVQPALGPAEIDARAVLELPSTSPANAAVSYDRLREHWSNISRFLRP